MNNAMAQSSIRINETIPIAALVQRSIAWAALCLVFMFVSCGADDGLERAIVSGSVTFDGTPIANGEIRFVPMDGTRGPISGAPIVDGEYVAKSNGGVPLGGHTVRIKAFTTDTKSGSVDERDDGEIQIIPAKYNRDSNLTADVDGKSDQVDFELTKD